MLFTISLIKIREGNGPRIEPCGTPVKIEAQSDIIPFIKVFVYAQIDN